jgi:hypothetical protein
MTGIAEPPSSGTANKPVTRRRQTPCSPPPKTRPGTYPRRPGAGPGRPSLRTHRHGISRRPVRVVLPDEPPALTPAAARALLRILLKARAETTGRQGTGDQP